MPGNDHRPKPRAGLAGDAVGSDLTLAELARLAAEEGKASGLSDEDGEALIDRLIAKYRSLVGRKSGS
ncbi:MAG: hypothetical protein ACREE4_13280 [Stellaceae bacterium]